MDFLQEWRVLMAGPRKDLLAKARNLRREMTKEERHLWYDFLCRYPVRFRRQRPMLDYIMDFYFTFYES